MKQKPLEQTFGEMKMDGKCQKGHESMEDRSGRNGTLTGRDRKVSARPATLHNETGQQLRNCLTAHYTVYTHPGVDVLM